jgi:hypothetical protein
MNTLMPELTNLGAIVRTILIGIVMIFITKGINRYLSYRSVKSIERRLKYLEVQKLGLENVAKSDRSIMLFSFNTFFGLFGSLAFAFAIQPVFSVIGGSLNIGNSIFASILIIIGIASWSAASFFKKMDKYPGSIEAINQERESLEAQNHGSP